MEVASKKGQQDEWQWNSELTSHWPSYRAGLIPRISQKSTQLSRPTGLVHSHSGDLIISSVCSSFRKVQMSVKRGCPWRCSKINNEDSLDSTRFLNVLASINPLTHRHRCMQTRPGSINQKPQLKIYGEEKQYLCCTPTVHVCHLEDQVRWQLEGGVVGSLTIPFQIVAPLADHRRDDHSHGALVLINAYNVFHSQTHPAGRSICVSSRQSPCPQNWKVIGQVRVATHKALLGKCNQEAQAQWVQLNRLL